MFNVRPPHSPCSGEANIHSDDDSQDPTARPHAPFDALVVLAAVRHLELLLAGGPPTSWVPSRDAPDGNTDPGASAPSHTMRLLGSDSGYYVKRALGRGLVVDASGVQPARVPTRVWLIYRALSATPDTDPRWVHSPNQRAQSLTKFESLDGNGGAMARKPAGTPTPLRPKANLLLAVLKNYLGHEGNPHGVILPIQPRNGWAGPAVPEARGVLRRREAVSLRLP
jgi:hypothetical protein